ncbi:hypothetical protein J1605_022433 [Eschrichtius robustus]|uniref:Uncharacterized protein n=1 Tax=Eschrichtius robustus TaxID=9764 RepID=A0AB34H938_ESCRO|nr:hypothetical protein J1605_022433 [Eschrichtius robustus]
MGQEECHPCPREDELEAKRVSSHHPHDHTATICPIFTDRLPALPVPAISAPAELWSELQELQKMIEGLQSPQDPTLLSQVLLLRREVMFLQFDAAVRYLIR